VPAGRVRGLSEPSSLGGRNVIDWKLIEPHWQDLMQVAISISEGRLSPATLMRRLRSNSGKNRSVRTVAIALPC
jgi:TnpA family transposase